MTVALPVSQEFLISAFEGKIIQEIELRIMSLTYRELVTEDRELVVTAAEGGAEQPAFDTPVKNYRIMEGMGVTFHCKMSGRPLPKVETLGSRRIQPSFDSGKTAKLSGVCQCLLPDRLVQRRPAHQPQ